jgi:prolyl 4-hydroxylase
MTIDLSSMLERHVVFTEGKLEAFKECATYVNAIGTEAFIKQPEMEVAMQVKVPDITVYSNFLTDAQCDELIKQAEGRVQRSGVMDKETGKSIVSAVRTSSGMFFKRGETPLITHIEKRISELTGVPVEHGEGLQILRYEIGQEYKPHHDYFDLNHSGFKATLEESGQRIGTFLMYLNTPHKGGATIFPESGISVKANKGNALLFKYPKGLPEEKVLHGGAPVEAGVKWVATKWLRERKFERAGYSGETK